MNYSSRLPDRGQTGSRRTGMMTAVCMGAFLSHFTAGVVNVSLPGLAAFFDTDLNRITWVTTGYLLVITALLPLMGKLGDRCGLGLVHHSGYLVFAAGSILAALASDVTVLLAFRVVQAAGAAMFQATNLALISHYMPKERRGRALGLVSTCVALGAMLGPAAGGWITQWLSWPWLFLIHVPAALVAAVLAFRFIPLREGERLRPEAAGASDRLGAVLFTACVAFAQLGIPSAAAQGWRSTGTMLYVGGALVTGIALILCERRRREPFLPLKALRIPAVSGGLLLSCAAFLLTNMLLVLLPFYLTGPLGGLPPSAAGLVMTAYPAALALAGPAAGRLSDRYDSGRFMVLGFVFMGAALAVPALANGHLPLGWIAFVLAAAGWGMGFAASPNNRFILQHTPAEHIGAVGGLIALTRNAGMGFGAALGLGVMSADDAGGPLLQAFRSAFGIGVWICLGTLVGLIWLLFHGGLRKQSAEAGRREGMQKPS
ncbi:major facilitator superfamily protein [Paenibacillus mucilaginosus 3016]|uniref:Major facilitator superfamily protein n=2 Tax=Paenibacillus mucilaginosus TaxID=61624 RepID=H6NAA1_9BACL|nr:major facilitator superfamily protein [Paenibacillus mucilaginosus 3016]